MRKNLEECKPCSNMISYGIHKLKHVSSSTPTVNSTFICDTSKPVDPSSLFKILIGKNAVCQRIKIIVLIKGNQIASLSLVLKKGSYIMQSAEKLKIKIMKV